jgi:DNA mismatch repair protein MutS2
VEFDAKTLRPMYNLNIGIPGSSNAIEIAKTLGLDNQVIEHALSLLSSEKVGFENVLKKAEESRRDAERLSSQLEELKQEKQKELNEIALEKEKIIKERERIYLSAKQETKRIVADKLADAEEIIAELKSILKKVGLESKEVFRASELKNRLANSRYLDSDIDDSPIELIKATDNQLIVGNKVYVKSLGAYAKLLAVRDKKKEAEILLGSIKTVVKLNDLYNSEPEVEQKKNVKIYKKTASVQPKTEINVVGMTELEALTEVEYFIDQAIVNNLEEIKVIHGVGQGVLLKSIRNYLKTDKNVLEFRRGKFGEGENGVTIIKLK